MPRIGTTILYTGGGGADVYWRVAVGSWKKLTPHSGPTPVVTYRNVAFSSVLAEMRKHGAA
jgi:hypothetical protein